MAVLANSLNLPSLEQLKAELVRRSRNRITRYYPDEGPLRRELYRKHTEFFAAGAISRERLMLAANRVGKTEGVGAYETALHLTGRYPQWWQGKRFAKPIKAWAAGDTNQTVRDIIQFKLLGLPGDWGTGMVPGDCIASVKSRASNIKDVAETVYVRHVSGGTSLLTLKSYEQGRKSFQGTEQDWIWLDEEPPQDVYSECLTRTMTTKGLVILTFTPLSGWTEVVAQFLKPDPLDKKPGYVVSATWDDVPHLSADDKEELYRKFMPTERDARSKGIPSLGSGAIYPVPESDVVVPDFDIPSFWPRVYGMDVGWNRTAVVWAARNPDTGVIYLYGEHYRGAAEPSIHAEAVRSRGEWIPGVIDPAARGRSQHDGMTLLQKYTDLGLKLSPAKNAVSAGLQECWELLSGGRLKVFQSLTHWVDEFRLYRRDEKGEIVKKDDHLMDATKYLVLSGRDLMTVKPLPPMSQMRGSFSNSWAG